MKRKQQTLHKMVKIDFFHKMYDCRCINVFKYGTSSSELHVKYIFLTDILQITAF